MPRKNTQATASVVTRCTPKRAPLRSGRTTAIPRYQRNGSRMMFHLPIGERIEREKKYEIDEAAFDAVELRVIEVHRVLL